MNIQWLSAYLKNFIKNITYSPTKGRMENITDFPLKNTDFSQNKGFSVTAKVSR